MTSGQSLEISQNNPLPNSAMDGFTHRLFRVVIVGLLVATGFIHWYLPVVHPTEMPGELTGGIIVIPHELLHILFDLSGVGYFVLAALVAGWLPLSTHHQKRLYIVVASYAALTIVAWILLSDATEHGVLDYIDKITEFVIVALVVGMLR